MNKKACFNVSVSYGQFLVWPGFADEYPKTNAGISPQELTQGFAWTSQIITFSIMNFGSNECCGAQVEVWEADEISLLPSTIRAMVLPFTITEGELVVSDLSVGNAQMITFAPGHYALVMEMKPRDDDEYLNSQEYQEDIEAGFIQAWCRLTLIPKQELVQPEILRTDNESAITYPLPMGVAVYKLASFKIDIQDAQFLVWSGPIPSDFTPPAINEQIERQGFSWTSHVISFLTYKSTEAVVSFSPGIGLVSSVPKEYSKTVAEVYKSDSEVGWLERAISLPFFVREGGITVSNLRGEQAYVVAFPPGNYQLVFQMSRKPDLYPNSARYKRILEEREEQTLWCSLILIPTEEPVQPKILTADKELAPTYPLLMGT
jgi:hypothetical protein